MAEIGCAFMLCQRQVFERMAAAYPERWMSPTADEPPLFDFFPVGLDDDGEYMSEDYNLCRLSTAIGGEIWLDPSVQREHVGGKVNRGDPRALFAKILWLIANLRPRSPPLPA